MRITRPRITIFVSYARANKVLAGNFLKRFHEQIRPARNYRYEFWQDGDIAVGEDWDVEIKKALDKCDLGLLLVSPAFLGSQYISEHELPRFVGEGAKPVIPIELQLVDKELHDLKGLQHKQFFRLENERFAHPKAFGECRTGLQRDQFALELFRQVEMRLERIYRR